MSYGNYPPAQRGGVYVNEGAKLAKQSWIFGLIGFFIFGIILGPIAIYKATQAKAMGSSATLGLTLGIIDTVFSVLGIIILLTNR